MLHGEPILGQILKISEMIQNDTHLRPLNILGHSRNIFMHKLNDQVCVTSSSPGNRVDGLPGAVSRYFWHEKQMF